MPYVEFAIPPNGLQNRRRVPSSLLLPSNGLLILASHGHNFPESFFALLPEVKAHGCTPPPPARACMRTYFEFGVAGLNPPPALPFTDPLPTPPVYPYP